MLGPAGRGRVSSPVRAMASLGWFVSATPAIAARAFAAGGLWRLVVGGVGSVVGVVVMGVGMVGRGMVGAVLVVVAAGRARGGGGIGAGIGLGGAACLWGRGFKRVGNFRGGPGSSA